MNVNLKFLCLKFEIILAEILTFVVTAIDCISFRHLDSQSFLSVSHFCSLSRNYEIEEHNVVVVVHVKIRMKKQAGEFLIKTTHFQSQTEKFLINSVTKL